MHGEQVLAQRDVPAIQIPDGLETVLKKGTQLRVTQSLGDTFTVMTPWGQMFRIDSDDADAIGQEVEAREDAEAGDDERSLEERLWDQLRTVYDPEIPVNIVELGLVYDCQVEESEAGHTITIKMTLTAPGCGMGEILAQDVRKKAESLAGVREVDVEIVFDPPWNPNMMSEAARLQLGFF